MSNPETTDADLPTVAEVRGILKDYPAADLACEAWLAGYKACVDQLRTFATGTLDSELSATMVRLADALEHWSFPNGR